MFVRARHNSENGSNEGENMLREELLVETVQLMDNLSSQFPVADGRTVAEICTDFCQINEPIRQFVVSGMGRCGTAEIDLLV